MIHYIIHHIEVIAEVITAAATTGLLLVAAVQLNAINKTSHADFIHRLNADLFRDRGLSIIRLILNKEVALKISGDDAIFTKNSAAAFDALTLDEAVLGPLEAVAVLERDGIVTLAMTYEMFSWYIFSLWENPVVIGYITWVRRGPYAWDLYENLEMLYKRLRAFSDHKRFLSDLWVCEIFPSDPIC